MKPLKWYRSLQTSRVRREEGVFLVEGERSISQVINSSMDSVEEILIPDTVATDFPEDIPVRVLPRKTFVPLCPSKTPAGPLAVVRIPPLSNSGELPAATGTRVALLEHVQDPGNVGTLIRTAAALDYDGIILSQECADPFGPKAVAASAGTLLSIWIRRSPDYLQMCRDLLQEKFHVFSADLDGKVRPEEAAVSGKTPWVLALGNEGIGLSDELLHLTTTKIKIPMNESKAESMNVAVSGGICMYALGSK